MNTKKQIQNTSKNIISVFIFSGIFFVFSFSFVNAFEVEKFDDAVENKIVVSPSKINLDLKEDQEITRKILIINRLGREEDFFIKTQELIGQAQLANLDEKYFPNLAVGWIRPEIDSITLEHGERVSLDVKIKIPKNIDPGGYYASLLIGVRSQEKNKDRSGVKFINQIGIPFSVSIPGEVYEKGEITNFSTDKRFYFWGPVMFLISFKNLGNIHLMPNQEISVHNFLGRKVAQIPLKEAVVFPGYEQDWQSFWNKKLLMGRYRANLSVFFERNEGEGQTKSVVFYAFPLHIFILIVFILILLYYSLRKIFSRFEIRKKTEAE